MKRILLAGTFALAAASPSLAADLPQPMAPAPRAPAAYVPAPSPVYDWAGIYVGINGGYGFGNSDWEPAGGTATGNFNVNGGLAGATIGANMQSGQFVFGIEADGDWSGLSGSTSSGGCALSTCTTSNNWLATVRGRAGYAFDRVLVYGTAGGAMGDVKAAIPTGSTDDTEFGWTAGAGVEVGLTPNLTAKVEYLFVDLANGSCGAALCGGTAVPVTFDTSLVRAGLNFKFNPF